MNIKTSNNEIILNSLQQFDFVFDVTNKAILVEDVKGNIALTNQNLINLFHINESSTALQNNDSAFLFETISKQTENIEKFLATVYTNKLQNQIRTQQYFKINEGFNFSLNYYPYFKENTQIGHIWVFDEKIENLKLDLKQISPENNYSIFATAINCINNEIAIYDAKANFIYVNKAYIPVEEKRNWVIGKNVEQYFSYSNLAAQVASNRLQNIEAAIRFKKAFSWKENGATENECILRTAYPILNEEKKLDGVLEYSCDISYQKRLEKELKNSLENFYNVTQNVDSIVLRTDSKLQLKHINENWNKFSSTNIDTIKGKSVFEVLQITNYQLYEKVFSVLGGKENKQTGIVSLKDKNGKIKEFEYNLFTYFNVEEESNGMIATLSDITSEKMQEKQLLELIKKEKELNELKSAFVNMVSHELRTPLTVISSSAEILDLMLKAGKGPEEVAIYTKQIIDEVEKMTAFMQDLLMISKIEAGKIVLNTSKNSVESFVKKIVNHSFNPWKDGRKAEVEVKRKSAFADIDSTLLSHSLENIIQNAFKYSSGNKAPKVRVGFSKTYFTISIVDSGIGIPKDDMKKLFTSFHRAGNTGNISGTGIGLVVAKYFTEQHKGSIVCKSVANKGSIFTLKIPYKH